MTLYNWRSNVTILVEFGFGSGPLATSPTFTDTAAYVQGLSTFRGRQSVRSAFDAGTVRITFNNVDGRFDPNNSSSPYYPNMKIGTPVRIRATHNAVTYAVWRGSVIRWPLSYPLDGFDGVVELEAVENMAVLNKTLFTFSAGSHGAGQRIASILDTVGWPAAARDIETGVTPLAAQEYVDAVALPSIVEAAEAEIGEFYVARNGDATFNNRVHFAGGTSSATFNVAGGLEYGDVSIAYDDDLLINHAVITAGDGGVGDDSDAASIAAHGSGLPYAVTLAPLISAPYAQNAAEWLVDKYKTVAPRITGLLIRPEVDPVDLFPQVLGRELRDLITIVVDPPGSGSTLTQLVGIEAIQHDVTSETWDTTFYCHPLAASELLGDYWILGVSDDLGVDTRLA